MAIDVKIASREVTVGALGGILVGFPAVYRAVFFG